MKTNAFMFAVGGALLLTLSPASQAQCPPQHLTSPSAFAGDYGEDLAMNDQHLLVGDSGDHTLCEDRFCPNGYAYAYERDGEGRWVLTQRIEPAGLGLSWGFGRAIALDGDRAIITRTFGPDCAGVPYIFEYDGERWVETGLLCPPLGRGGEGAGVALHGGMALVRTVDENVLVYHEGDEGWRITHDLASPDSPSVTSGFGASFDLDDDWVLIGAPSERLTVFNGGAVYVYRRLPEGRVELAQKLVAPDVLDGPRFGSSISLDGRTLAVGASLADRDFDRQGVVYMFTLVDGRWELRQELTHENPDRSDQLGGSVDLTGDLLLAGAIFDRTPVSFGGAYLFQRGTDGQWRQAAEVFPPGFAVDYGARVSVVGTSAAIGGENSVHAFDLSCFLCPADLDADGTLTIFDFLTFANLFDTGDAQADLDGDGELTIFDFLAFQTAFDAGCA